MDYSEFLNNHGLNPSLIDVELQSEKMLSNMQSALNGKIIDMPMIPTYLKTQGTIEKGRSAVVIDAGGTNYRCALATYNGYSFDITDLYKSKMPGTDGPVSWEAFISSVADSLMPIMDKADVIGFCFSYKVEITPDLDGIVATVDKEVTITGCDGKLLASDLLAELGRRGITGKKCVILNDTVAALFGNSASRDCEKYSGAMGMICGTGVNTCAAYNGMLINLESGFYLQMPRGDFDIILDSESQQPNEKLMEKICSGAYIGKLAKLALNLEGNADGSTVDMLSQNGDDFSRAVCCAILERSARCMASNIIAIMKLTGNGLDKPMCVCAEGSLIERSALYLPYLRSALEKYSGKYKAEIVIGHETTLPGSAAAALLNT